MARLTRFIFGGVVGAGLALLFAPKSGRELRKMLAGEIRPALPPPEEASAPQPAAEVDLGAKVEETRQTLETGLRETFATQETVVEAPVTEEPAATIETETPPEAAPPVEEAPPETAPPEEAVEDAAAVEEEVIAEEVIAEEAVEEEAVEEEAPVLKEVKEEVPEAAAPAETEAPPAEDFEALKTPAEGEPVL